MIKRMFLSAALSGALLLGGVNAVFAGEVTGNGKDLHYVNENGDLVLHGKSACAYSGLEDEPHAPGSVQTYGQIVKAGGKAFAPSPSIGCNPTVEFEE